MRRQHRRSMALLALPTLINAVALSDMAPRAQNLPPACNKIYTQQISGCTATDFSTRHCSSSCIQALESLVVPIQEACGNQGVAGENLIVAFLAGVGPQQICPDAPPWESNTWAPQGHGGTTTAGRLGPSDTASLLVDTSSTMTQTAIPKATHSWKHPSSVFKGTSTASGIATSTGSLDVDTSHTPTTATASQTATGHPQANLHDHSGGGSPFDTAGNTGGAASFSFSAALALLSATAALFAIFP